MPSNKNLDPGMLAAAGGGELTATGGGRGGQALMIEDAMEEVSGHIPAGVQPLPSCLRLPSLVSLAAHRRPLCRSSSTTS